MPVYDDNQFAFVRNYRRILRIIFTTFCICFCLVAVGLHSLLVLPFLLLFGWLSFLTTVIPQIVWNWNAIMLGALCVIGFIIGWHYLAGWLRGAMRPDQPSWPWRWTIISSLAVLIVFTASISVIGLIHQVTWLVTTKEPMTRDDNLYSHLKIMNELQSAIIKKNKNSDKSIPIRGAEMRAEIAKALEQARAPNVRILILSDENDALTGAVIDLRETRLGKRHPFVCYRWNPQEQRMNEVEVEADRVLEFIAEAEGNEK